MVDPGIWWPAILAGGTFLVVVLLFIDLRRRDAGVRRHSPFAEEFLQSPGHALRRSAESVGRRVVGALVFAAAWPLLVFGAWGATYWLAELPRNPTLDQGLAAVLVLGWGLGVLRLLAMETRFRRLRIALDGEIATGQMLTRLAGTGCRVFHDVATGAGRVSHVVVSPAAVFAIRTVARRRARRGRGKEDVTVFVTSDELKFPDGKDLAAVTRARKTAMSLAEAVKSRLGRSVEVRPVVFLPGWFVENRVASDVRVMNPGETGSLVAGAPVHGPEAIEAIANAVEDIARGEPPPAPAKKSAPPPVERREPTL